MLPLLSRLTNTILIRLGIKNVGYLPAISYHPEKIFCLTVVNSSIQRDLVTLNNNDTFIKP